MSSALASFLGQGEGNSSSNPAAGVVIPRAIRAINLPDVSGVPGIPSMSPGLTNFMSGNNYQRRQDESFNNIGFINTSFDSAFNSVRAQRTFQPSNQNPPPQSPSQSSPASKSEIDKKVVQILKQNKDRIKKTKGGSVSCEAIRKFLKSKGLTINKIWDNSEIRNIAREAGIQPRQEKQGIDKKSSEKRKKAVIAYIEAHPKESDAEIAREFNKQNPTTPAVHSTTVNSYRRKNRLPTRQKTKEKYAACSPVVAALYRENPEITAKKAHKKLEETLDSTNKDKLVSRSAVTKYLYKFKKKKNPPQEASSSPQKKHKENP